MDFAVRQPRHAMVHAAGQFADLRMQRAAERHIHLLKTAADAEQRHAARNAGLDQLERDGVATSVVRLVRRMLVAAEMARMDVGAGAGEQNAVDGIEQRADIGDLRRAGKHQRQRPCGVGDRAQIALADPLRGEFALDGMGAADDADDGAFRSHFRVSTIPLAT